MIFTSRFGALAARPVFPRIDAPGQERAPEHETREVEYHQRSEKSAA